MLTRGTRRDRDETYRLSEQAGRVHRGDADCPAASRLGFGRERARYRGLLGLSTADLDGVATFYNLIRRKPVGQHVALICDSVSCWIMGCERVRDHLCGSSRHAARRNHSRRAIHFVTHCLPGSLRSRARHDDRWRAA